MLLARAGAAVLVAALGLGSPVAVAAPGFRTNDITRAGFDIHGFALTDHLTNSATSLYGASG
jgi:hypothetical protein